MPRALSHRPTSHHIIFFKSHRLLSSLTISSPVKPHSLIVPSVLISSDLASICFVLHRLISHQILSKLIQFLLVREFGWMKCGIMDADFNHQSTSNIILVASFFISSPSSKPLRLNLVFITRVDGCKMMPIL